LPNDLTEKKFEVISHTGKDYIKLDEYKDKLLIIDFWATWCSTCLATFPKLDSIQLKYGENVAILLATQENSLTASPVIQRHDWRLTSIVNGELLNKYFPHRFIPHCIWIKDGKIQAITSSAEVTEENILRTINHSSEIMKEK